MEQKFESDTAFKGWKVFGPLKEAGKGVKFTISKSSKDKKTDTWTTVYVNVLCFGPQIPLAERFALDKTKVYVKGRLTTSEYKGKSYLSLFCNELEPMSDDAYDKAITKVAETYAEPGAFETFIDNPPF